MSALAGVEVFLARLYVDAAARRDFLADPRGSARRAGLAEADVEALARLDPDDLELAARSFEAKRSRPRPARPWWRVRLVWLRAWAR
jgi:hypothetical protein